MLETPHIVQTESLHYACVRRQCPVAEIAQTMMPAIGEVVAALKAQGIQPSGPWFTHHFQRPMVEFDFEVCFPVATPVEPAGDVYPAVWPEMQVARTVYHGHYSGLGESWPRLEQWMKAEGYTGATEFWERYLVNPQDDPTPENWRTELNWPLA